MTVFGWDTSHYDGDLTTAVLARAKAEGIEFFTHKIGEGLSNTDDTAAAALNAARDAGIRVIGGYYFIHSGDMLAQATRFITLADRMVPWWRTFDGWFWQTDAETDTAGHLPSAAEVKVFSDAVAHQSGKTVVVYASHGMYGNRLAGLGHPLWNANYPTNRQAPFKLLYPGDGYAGWNDYSGQTPALCQYTSSATIAGLSTCDANGFRGTIDQLLELINPGGTDMSAQFTADLLEAFKDPHVAQALRAFPWQYSGGGLPTGVPSALLTLSGTYDNTDAMKTALAAINAKLDGLAQGGGVVDLAAVRAIVRAELDATHLTGAAPEPAAG